MSELHLTSVPHEEYGFSFSVRHIRADRLRLAGELAALWVPGASEETRAWLRDGLLEAAPPALLHGLGALAMPDVEGSYAEVRVPTMVLCGHTDPLVSFEEAAALARAIPGTAFTPLHTPGHLPMLTDPDGLTALLRAFIDGGQGDDATSS